jgi:DNA uptake protein ComE-like DNA-binding protein
VTDVSHDSANLASEWLPKGTKPPAPQHVNSEVREWQLDEPAPPSRPKAKKPALQITREGADPAEDALRERADKALAEREAEIKERLDKRYDERQADLDEQFERRQTEFEKHVAALEERLDAREAELLEQAARLQEELEGRIEELQSALAEARQRATTPPPSPAPTPEIGQDEKPKRWRRRANTSTSDDGGLDINEASFEQLRELGLSVTQTARVIAYRDTRRGFDSLDELDEVPGLPKEVRAELRAQLRL